MPSQQLRRTFLLLANEMLKTVAAGIHESLIPLKTVSYDVIHLAPKARNGDNDVFAALATTLLRHLCLSEVSGDILSPQSRSLLCSDLHAHLLGPSE